MAEYLVELYVSRDDPVAVESGAERARAAADEVTEEGAAVRYVRAIFVPEDETCFFLYEAASAAAVHDAARRAGLSSGRIIEALGARKGDGACL
ncbi:MAG TPA: nickel-binding protein [Gaiellaceae bacterium]|nr:nickel-binding protein [Gaiellaceae bacterium]